MKDKKLSITNIPAISAIYFALLQRKYNFNNTESDESIVSSEASLTSSQPQENQEEDESQMLSTVSE